MANARIVACARDWLGTRFHHQGRLKKTDRHKGGVDCLGLLIGIAGELGLVQANGEPFALLDETDYPHYPDTVRLRNRLEQVLTAIKVEDISPGDILLLQVDDNPQHLAVAGDGKNGLSIIHAYAPARAVVEHDFDDWWRARIEAAFRYL